MYWSLIIFVSLHMLVVETENDNYEHLLQGFFPIAKQHEDIPETTSAVTTTSGENFRRCGINKICVPRFLCNAADNSVDTSGRKIIDIRINSKKVCNYLEKCCHRNDKKDQPILPGYQPNGHPQGNPAINSKEFSANPESTLTVDLNKGCGYRNNGGVLFNIRHATHNEAQYAEFPWMVAILKKELVIYICGGSLISPTIVLASAHNLINQVATMLKVRAGEWDMQTESEPLAHQEKNVSEIIRHESFNNETLFFDVALLRLQEPFTLQQNVQPICLPPADQRFDNSRCFVTGWGKNKFGRDGRYQHILKKIDVPMVPWIDCQKQLRKTRLSSDFELHNSFICAGGELDHDACTGDGGSPLVCRIPGSIERYFQAGIVSWGIGCGNQDVPGVYTSILHVLPWLTENLNKLNADRSYYIA